MKAIEIILNLFPDEDCIRLESKGFMPLVIERIGKGPHNWPAISVCHYGEQNGDAMRDPEVCFEILPDGVFNPYYFRNDYAGIEQEVYITRNGQRLVAKGRLSDLKAFARVWNRNIREQGFLDAAKQKAKALKLTGNFAYPTAEPNAEL